VKLSPLARQLVSGEPGAWTGLLGRPVRQMTSSRSPHKGSSSSLRQLQVLFESGERLDLLVKFTDWYEARIYRDLVPNLPLDVPRVYYTEEAGRDGMCLLETLPPGKPISAWNEQDERNVLTDLAHLHARFWRSPEMDHYPWLLRWQDELNTQLDKAERGLRLLRQIGGWPGLITPHTLDVMGKLLADRAQLLAPVRDLPLTLIHCDAWQPNWILSDDRRVLLDWQSVSCGPAVWDVVYFLEMSGEAGGRLPLEESDALNDYLDTLVAAQEARLLGEGRLLSLRREFLSAVPAASVINTLARWTAYALDYLRPIEYVPVLAQVWKGLPSGLRRKIEAWAVWTDTAYYQQTFERFEERAEAVYSV